MGGGTLAPSVEQRVGQGFGMGRRILLGPKVWRPERAGFFAVVVIIVGVFCCGGGCLFDFCFG